MNEEDFKIINTMKRFGGSFVLRLAQLAEHADPENLSKIKKTWPEYWEQYKKMGREKPKEDA